MSLLTRTPGLWERLTEVGYETLRRAPSPKSSRISKKNRLQGQAQGREMREADPRSNRAFTL